MDGKPPWWETVIAVIAGATAGLLVAIAIYWFITLI